MKKPAKILTSIFLIIFIIQMVSIIVLFLLPQTSNAAEVQFTPQVEIPGMANNLNSAGNGSYTINENSIGNYIKTIYNYAIGIVGIVAAAVLMWGGVTWLTAGGSPDKVNNAKSWITASLTGLLLAFSSYFILATINPNLVNFKSINVPAPASSSDDSGSQDETIFRQNCTEQGGEVIATENKVNAEAICDTKCDTNYKPINNDSNNNYCCICNTTEAANIADFCADKNPGQTCSMNGATPDGWCYDGQCVSGDGAINEPCGDDENSACMKESAILGLCPSGYSHSGGGRDCDSDSDLRCCYPN